MAIKTKAARQAVEGETLYQHTVHMRRQVEFAQSGEIEIITTSETISDNEFSEIWDQIDADDLPEEDFTWDERNHEEEIINSKQISPETRCRYTMEMFE